MRAPGIGCLVVPGVIVCFALVLGCCAPITLRLAAPVACPDGYARSAVVVEVTNPEPGTTNIDSDLYCVDRSGFPVHASWIVAVFTLAAELASLALTLGALAALGNRLTRRSVAP